MVISGSLGEHIVFTICPKWTLFSYFVAIKKVMNNGPEHGLKSRAYSQAFSQSVKETKLKEIFVSEKQRKKRKPGKMRNRK
jgi:hypothetical protein